MDFIFDMFTLRNVNRPYTKKELEDMYKKDHSIRNEDKQSRLRRCVSVHDVEEDCKNDTLPQSTMDTDTHKK
jgi:hypothetical protein